MVQIRYNIFETNSSSSDYYNDGPDYGPPTITHAYQTIHIKFKFEEGLSEEQQNQITENIIDDLATCEFNEPIEEMLNYEYFDYELESTDLGGAIDEIYIQVKVFAEISWIGGYPQTRYEPAEPAEPQIDFYYELSNKNKQYDKIIADAKINILKAIRDKGYKEIIGIADIYGTEVDEQDYYDNIEDYY